MDLYLSVALMLYRMTGTQPSFLLHPLDFMGSELVPELAFFPGMDVSSERKIQIFDRVIRKLSRHFNFTKMSTYARLVKGKTRQRIVQI